MKLYVNLISVINVYDFLIVLAFLYSSLSDFRFLNYKFFCFVYNFAITISKFAELEMSRFDDLKLRNIEPQRALSQKSYDFIDFNPILYILLGNLSDVEN